MVSPWMGSLGALYQSASKKEAAALLVPPRFMLEESSDGDPCTFLL
jgi:hypothetical protein